MPRVTKAPEVRREELLDTALELCRLHGFDDMSVEQVTQAAGVAKGTFYHYFTSKSDLQWQLVQRFGEALFTHLSARMATAVGTGAERLRILMDASAGYKAQNLDAVTYAPFLERDQNYELRHRLFGAWREQTRVVLLPVVTDGSADGSFDVADAEATTDILLGLWFDAADALWLRAAGASDADAFADTMVNGSAAITLAQERILGVPPGTYQVPIGPEIIAAIKGLYHQYDRTDR